MKDMWHRWRICDTDEGYVTHLPPKIEHNTSTVSGYGQWPPYSTSLQVRFKCSNRSVTNLSKVSAFRVLLTLIIPRVTKSVLEKTTFTVRYLLFHYSFLRFTTVSSLATSQNSFTFTQMVVWEIWATLYIDFRIKLLLEIWLKDKRSTAASSA